MSVPHAWRDLEARKEYNNKILEMSRGGMSKAEIAEAEGVSYGAVKYAIDRAITGYHMLDDVRQRTDEPARPLGPPPELVKQLQWWGLFDAGYGLEEAAKKLGRPPGTGARYRGAWKARQEEGAKHA